MFRIIVASFIGVILLLLPGGTASLSNKKGGVDIDNKINWIIGLFPGKNKLSNESVCEKQYASYVGEGVTILNEIEGNLRLHRMVVLNVRFDILTNTTEIFWLNVEPSTNREEILKYYKEDAIYLGTYGMSVGVGFSGAVYYPLMTGDDTITLQISDVFGSAAYTNLVPKDLYFGVYESRRLVTYIENTKTFGRRWKNDVGMGSIIPNDILNLLSIHLGWKHRTTNPYWIPYLGDGSIVGIGNECDFDWYRTGPQIYLQEKFFIDVSSEIDNLRKMNLYQCAMGLDVHANPMDRIINNGTLLRMKRTLRDVPGRAGSEFRFFLQIARLIDLFSHIIGYPETNREEYFRRLFNARRSDAIGGSILSPHEWGNLLTFRNIASYHDAVVASVSFIQVIFTRNVHINPARRQILFRMGQNALAELDELIEFRVTQYFDAMQRRYRRPNSSQTPEELRSEQAHSAVINTWEESRAQLLCYIVENFDVHGAPKPPLVDPDW